MDILELRIIFEHFVKQSSQQISMSRRFFFLSLHPPTPVFCGRGHYGERAHRATQGEKRKAEVGKDREIGVPNQTAGDITVLCVFAFYEASLVFKR